MSQYYDCEHGSWFGQQGCRRCMYQLAVIDGALEYPQTIEDLKADLERTKKELDEAKWTLGLLVFREYPGGRWFSLFNADADVTDIVAPILKTS